MPKPRILISIETHAQTETTTFGERLVENLCENGSLVPEFVSTSETFKDRFESKEQFLRNWWAIPRKQVDGEGLAFGEAFIGPMWKRKSALASRGAIEHGSVGIRGHKSPSSIWFESRWSRHVDFDRLFSEWTELSRPEIGMLHLFTEPELQTKSEAARSFELGLFGGPMKPGLPNLGWAMAFGKSFAADVDALRIKDAGFSVLEHDGVTMVSVTDNLSDVIDNFAHFSQRRAKLKSLFRPGLFRIIEEPPCSAR
jgi:hypothetical protein